MAERWILPYFLCGGAVAAMAEEQDAPVETFDQYSHSVYNPITPGAHMDSYKVSLRSPKA